jgi:hypothetical protein
MAALACMATLMMTRAAGGNGGGAFPHPLHPDADGAAADEFGLPIDYAAEHGLPLPESVPGDHATGGGPTPKGGEEAVAV